MESESQFAFFAVKKTQEFKGGLTIPDPPWMTMAPIKPSSFSHGFAGKFDEMLRMKGPDFTTGGGVTTVYQGKWLSRLVIWDIYGKSMGNIKDIWKSSQKMN